MSEREYAGQGGGTEGVSRILERVGRREGGKRTKNAIGNLMFTHDFPSPSLVGAIGAVAT